MTDEGAPVPATPSSSASPVEARRPRWTNCRRAMLVALTVAGTCWAVPAVAHQGTATTTLQARPQSVGAGSQVTVVVVPSVDPVAIRFRSADGPVLTTLVPRDRQAVSLKGVATIPPRTPPGSYSLFATTARPGHEHAFAETRVTVMQSPGRSGSVAQGRPWLWPLVVLAALAGGYAAHARTRTSRRRRA